ncbi:MAG: hypothetical protein LC646_06165, partial [Xanthomonadaceae bacterium]|nr:hypothetical protein [Xanthomonadaceae bacterium]
MNKFRTLTLVCTALLLPSLVACAGAQTEAQKPAPMTKTAEANSVSQLFSVFHDDGRFYAFGDHELYRT